jgi:hypothetical protein
MTLSIFSYQKQPEVYEQYIHNDQAVMMETYMWAQLEIILWKVRCSVVSIK